jgi:branched-chain amino acid aminotransferase
MAKWVFLNDAFVEEEKASLHFRDLSFQRGYGIFDFFRLIGNAPLFLEDHLDRFFSSAEKMHLEPPVDRADFKTIISQLIQKNDLPGTGIRLSLTGGYSEDGFTLARPNLVISQHYFTLPTKEQLQTGIKLISHPYQRQLSQIKTIDYLMAIWLQPLRIKHNADDILYHQNGVVSECPRSNFFLVTTDEKIITPLDDVLKGITRKKLLDMAGRHYPVEQRAVTMDDVKAAREAFITSTTKQILPVRQIDQVQFGKHDIADHLQQLFTAFIKAQ